MKFTISLIMAVSTLAEAASQFKSGDVAGNE